MTSVFSKLTIKDQPEILVLNSPESFDSELAVLQGIKVLRDVRQVVEIVYALVFVMTQQQVKTAIQAISPKVKGDAQLWFAYPKGTSKKYKSEINRDTGWTPLGEAGFEPVRQVAIDEDWSALRFRRVEFITTMKRRESMALSKAGKAKTQS